MVGAGARTPTALIVVAAWREGAPSRVAARITYTLDADHGTKKTVTAAGVDEILAVVRSWLDRVCTGDAPVTGE